ncbi:MAG: sulfatase family protein, partial [Bryobacteraceae bacterium]
VLQAQRKPNILILVGDDHTQDDLGCYGNKVVRTPHLDRIAAEGMRCTSVFTATAMCSPSRSTMYTGLYPHRHGCHMNHGAVREGTESMPHYLGRLGYRVGLAGKTHIKPEQSFPFERMPNRNRELDFESIDRFMSDRTPFCLIVASNEPHTPHRKARLPAEDIVVPPNLVDTPETRNDLAGYYADIEHLDWQVGKTLESLRKAGAEKDTLVIYAGDHGHHYFAKWTCYDAGLRAPFLVRWPGMVEANSVSEAMISFVDILPTLIDAAGGERVPAFDGRSFLPVLMGKETKHHDVIYGAHTTRGIINGSTYPIRCVRTRDYKYIRNLAPGNTFENNLMRGPEWEAWKRKAQSDSFAARRVKMYQHRPGEELYDLRSDPWELVNKAGESGQRERLAAMSTMLKEWMKQQGDTGLEAEQAVPERPNE